MLNLNNYALPKKLFAIAFAKDFRNKATLEKHHWEKNRLEQLGEALRSGVSHTADFLLKEIKNPIMIVGLTSLALLGVSIAFYPTTVLAVTATVLPFALKIRPWMLQMALYILTQVTILGVGLRTYGRLSNPSFMRELEAGHLKAIYIGEKKVVYR